MSDILLDLWLDSPSISNPGVIAAFIVTALVGRLCFIKFRTKTWNIFSKSLGVALWCFVSQLIALIIGVLALATGYFGMARSWTAFGDGYIWGVFTTPFLAFLVSLGAFALTLYMDSPKVKRTDR